MASSSSESEGDRGLCRRKAMDLLARRPHFRRQLEDKLRQRGFEETDLRRVCDDLEQRGYLNDLECARGLAGGSFRRKGFGPRRIRAELTKRGAEDAVVDQVAAEAFEEGESVRLREYAEGWLRRQGWDKRRLGRHLERKGFTTGAILSVLEDLAPSDSGREPSDFD